MKEKVNVGGPEIVQERDDVPWIPWSPKQQQENQNLALNGCSLAAAKVLDYQLGKAHASSMETNAQQLLALSVQRKRYQQRPLFQNWT